MYPAREAFAEAAKSYDAALDRYIKAWQQHREKLLISYMSHVVAKHRSASYKDQVEGEKEHKEMLKHILEYFN